MTTSPGTASPVPPSWPHCGSGAGPADPVGCRGRRVDPHPQCLAHLTPADRAAHFAALAPGADVDHRGTTIDQLLLPALLTALDDSATGRPHLGGARFDGATFSDDAVFDGATFIRGARFNDVTFSGVAGFGDATFPRYAGFGNVTFAGYARFERATFSGGAGFGNVTFARDAGFEGATFASYAGFDSATFSADAGFDEVTFSSAAVFDGATFAGHVGFGGATFAASAVFDEATFTGDAFFNGVTFARDAGFGGATFASYAGFDGATFTAAPQVGPLVCAGTVDLSRAVFGAPVTVEVAAARVACVRTRWEATATLRLRYAELDLTDAVVTQPLAVLAHPAPFTTDNPPVPLPETALPGTPAVRVASLRGVDAMHVVLTDTDLSGCRFAGAFHLDQLRLEGDTGYAQPPTGWRLRSGVPARLTRRRTLAEEHHWRALAPGNPQPPRGWTPGPDHPDPDLSPGPHDVAPLYRALRKAFEDGKNEPGAADFYYGEMEMRRHDRRTPVGERALITGYWLLSGYGLRASRALGWLLAAMTATVLAMMLWGLPTHDPKPRTTGTLTAGQRVDLTTDNPDPELHGPYADRFTSPRAEKAARVVVNSVVFRSSGQNLTTAGTYIEMASRFTDPVLLALAALAVRGRVKR
ncbi:pentapeptide repeat-containing protein [Yinghuangia aomiensis]